MSNPANSSEFVELVLRSLQGDLGQAERAEFEHILKSDPQAARIYLELLEVCVELSPQGRVDSGDADTKPYDDLLQSMSQYEKTAPPMKIELAPPVPAELIKSVTYQRVHHKISRFSVISLITSAAAMLLIILFAYYGGPSRGVEVATLSESLNAKWNGMDRVMEKGSRLVTGQDCVLSEGSIELRFDNHAKVVIEGPAEFRILLEDQVKLAYGALYAVVPQEAIGFRVSSPNALIVDLGTEFGVSADLRGNTELHVIKGKTTLIAGEKTGKVGLAVNAGTAKKVSVDSEISEIRCDDRMFITAIDSRNKHLWRGSVTVDLADIVSGGNGLVPAERDRKTFEKRQLPLQAPEMKVRLAAPGDFYPIPQAPFIEGIFLPDGSYGSIPVVKDGTIRWNAPKLELRQRIGYVRFDISAVTGSKEGARLSLTNDSIAQGSLVVYGLIDESGDLWDEDTISYLNAPGFHPAKQGQYNINQNAMVRLGTLTQMDDQHYLSDAMQLPLDDFMRRDTNGLVTLVILSEAEGDSRIWSFAAKESDPSRAPALLLPGAEKITTDRGRGADTTLCNDSVQEGGVNLGRQKVISVRSYWKKNFSISNQNYVSLIVEKQMQNLEFSIEGFSPEKDPQVVTICQDGAITFDLQAIQQSLPAHYKLEAFNARCAHPVINTADGPMNEAVVDFFVLVDGKERFRKSNVVSGSAAEPVEVQLNPGDRYLTLAKIGGGVASLFVNPTILFSESNE